MKRLTTDRQLTFLVSMNVALVVLASIASNGMFADVDNLQSMGGQVSELGILAVAVMLAMISGNGGIDLSEVALANLSGIVAGLVSPYLYSPDESPMAFTLVFTSIALLIGALGR